MTSNKDEQINWRALHQTNFTVLISKMSWNMQWTVLLNFSCGFVVKHDKDFYTFHASQTYSRVGITSCETFTSCSDVSFVCKSASSSGLSLHNSSLGVKIVLPICYLSHDSTINFENWHALNISFLECPRKQHQKKKNDLLSSLLGRSCFW